MPLLVSEFCDVRVFNFEFTSSPEEEPVTCPVSAETDVITLGNVWRLIKTEISKSINSGRSAIMPVVGFV
jgi:hypothetical protein